MSASALRRGSVFAGLLLLAALPLAVGGAENRTIPVGGLTALPGAESPGPNLVKNPNFEAPAGDLAGWNARVGGPWSIDRGGRGGRPALRLTGAEAQSGVPQLEQTVTLEPGLYTVGGWFKANSLGTKDPRSGVRVCLDARPRFNWWHCTEVIRGTTDWTQLTKGGIAVAERGPYKVAVGAYGEPDDSAWFDEISLTERRKTALEVYLLYHNFRSMLLEDRRPGSPPLQPSCWPRRARRSCSARPGGSSRRCPTPPSTCSSTRTPAARRSPR